MSGNPYPGIKSAHARAGVHLYIEDGSRFVIENQSGAKFWAQHVTLNPLGWDEWKATLRGPAIGRGKREGEMLSINREGTMPIVELPEFVREAIAAELRLHIDGLQEFVSKVQRTLGGRRIVPLEGGAP
jgi:hypothetical protein